MDVPALFEKFPYLREALTAFAVIFVDVCALLILAASRRERRRGSKSWAKESHSYMLQCGQNLYSLSAAEILIGRHPCADIHFPDNEVSRFHALLSLCDGTWIIEDLGAQNGVLVNSRRITQPCRIRRGDVVTVGKRQLTVVKASHERSV